MNEVVLAADVAATLRALQPIDIDSEPLVYRIRFCGDHVVLAATDNDLESGPAGDTDQL